MQPILQLFKIMHLFDMGSSVFNLQLIIKPRQSLSGVVSRRHAKPQNPDFARDVRLIAFVMMGVNKKLDAHCLGQVAYELEAITVRLRGFVGHEYVSAQLGKGLDVFGEYGRCKLGNISVSLGVLLTCLAV